MSPIRVFLVDDHTVLRQAVAAMLAGENDMEVVGQSGDGRRALDELGRLRPDVVILDLKMPETDGLSLLPQILEASPKSRVVMFTMYENPIYVHTAMQAGATGSCARSAPFTAAVAISRPRSPGRCCAGSRSRPSSRPNEARSACARSRCSSCSPPAAATRRSRNDWRSRTRP
jgi:DNA-binding NarL/FixJ family response regulator